MKKEKDKQVIRIDSADQLQALVAQPVICRFMLDEQVIEVPVTRLSAATAERVRALRRAAQPEWVKERNDYDHTGAKYLAARDQNERIARAVMIYCHCPAVAAQKPALQDNAAILAHVQSLFSENILDVIAIAIQGGGLDLEERINFTSTHGSAPS
jgi:hypothetical protein